MRGEENFISHFGDIYSIDQVWGIFSGDQALTLTLAHNRKNGKKRCIR